jgi:hypothetical protein
VIAGALGASGYPTAHAYTAAFTLCAIALATGVVTGLLIPQRRPGDAFVGGPVESTG